MWKEGSGGYFGHKFIFGQLKHNSEVISIQVLALPLSCNKPELSNRNQDIISNDCQRKHQKDYIYKVRWSGHWPFTAKPAAPSKI